MKICGACNELFESILEICPRCEIVSTKIDAAALSGFKSEYFAKLALLEENNFWFKARNKLIIWALLRYFSKMQTFFEIGCGTGYVLSGIQKAFPNVNLQGSEIFCEGLKFAAERVRDANLFQMDARNIPYQDEFDVIGAFDVLEHIDEDEKVLREIHKALHGSGGIILTVPQHQFLWSVQDELACHVRRYSRAELANKLTKAGFKIVKMTSFVTFLLPCMYVSRFTKNKNTEHDDPLSELKLPKWINLFFEKCLDAERQLIQYGMNLPIGGSLLVIAKKIELA